jgi:hypothetical protein
MGIVYEAEDTRLGRHVALFLEPRLARRGRLLQRLVEQPGDGGVVALGRAAHWYSSR